MNIGINTFGLRGVLYRDWEGTLDRLLAAGVNTLEVCVAFPSNLDAMPDFPEDPNMAEMSGGIWQMDVAPQRIKEVRAKGFQVVGVHPMCFYSKPEELEALTPLFKSFAKENDIEYYAVSPMRDADEIGDFIPTLKKISDQLSADGITFMIHNHEKEVKVIEGKSALDLVLEAAPNLKLELDVGWAVFGGANPVDLMEKYKKQFGIVHLKDVEEGANESNRDSCFTPVGEGAVPLKAVIQKAMTMNLGSCYLVIDQDNSKGDMVEDVCLGAQNIKKKSSQFATSVL